MRSQALDDLLSFVDSFHGNIVYIVGKESMNIYSEKKLKFWLKNFILKMIYKPLFSIYTKIVKQILNNSLILIDFLSIKKEMIFLNIKFGVYQM